MPIIVVGGGASLLPPSLLDKRFIIPPYASVANAYGAALVGIAGVVDTIVSLGEDQQILASLKEQAMTIAKSKGAVSETIKITDIQIMPYHYVPNNIAMVVITAYGEAFVGE